MRLFSQAVLAALLIAALAACDSGTTGPDGQNLDGYTGDPALLGMWREPGDTDILYFSYDASTRTTTGYEIEDYTNEPALGNCYDIDEAPLTTLTTTSLTGTFFGEVITYSYRVNGDRLTLARQGGSGNGWERSIETLASLTPVCS